MLILGPKEEEAGSVSVRSRAEGEIGGMEIPVLIEKMKKENDSKGAQ
jgi:threonyl-tRNA synthetase